MANPTKKTPAARVFAHLTDEERLDMACELLAIGVLRLAEKRGLLRKGKGKRNVRDPSTPKGVIETEMKEKAAVLWRKG